MALYDFAFDGLDDFHLEFGLGLACTESSTL